MPSTTARLALPYPVPADTVDVPRDVQALADKLDAFTSLQAPLVSALPGSPVDGQECYFQVSAANGIIWHLRYRDAAPGSYKWEFIGGPPSFNLVATNEGLNSAVYGDLATVGPSVTLPLAGDYYIDHGFWVNNAGANADAFMSYAVGATAAVDADAAKFRNATAAAVQASLARRQRKNGMGAVTITAKYRSSPGATYGDRWMGATPIRVG